MPLPRFIDIDGRRHLWRDLVNARRAQAMPKAEQPALFELREDHRPPASGMRPNAIASRACSPCWTMPLRVKINFERWRVRTLRTGSIWRPAREPSV